MIRVFLLAFWMANRGLWGFSPDGTAVLCRTGAPNGGASIVKTDGTVRPIPLAEQVANATWAPDGKHVLLIGGAGTSPDRMTSTAQPAWLYDTASGKTTRLNLDLLSPVAWREDGSRFAARRALENGDTDMILYNLADAGITLRVPLPGNIKAVSHLVWLPGTDDVAFVGSGDSGEDVYSLEAGEYKTLTTSHDIIGLALTGDRKGLLWARQSPNPRYICTSVYAYDLTARSVKRLPLPNAIPAINPTPKEPAEAAQMVTFSSDGSRLGILTFKKTTKPAQTTATWWSVRMDGSAGASLVRVPIRSLTAPPEMSWAPNGRTAAVRVVQNGTAKVVLKNADGTTVRAMASGAAR